MRVLVSVLLLVNMLAAIAVEAAPQRVGRLTQVRDGANAIAGKLFQATRHAAAAVVIGCAGAGMTGCDGLQDIITSVVSDQLLEDGEEALEADTEVDSAPSQDAVVAEPLPTTTDDTQSQEGNNTQPPDGNPLPATQDEYSISPADLGTRFPGYLFTVEIVADSDAAVPPSALGKRLAVYDNQGVEVAAALAMWKEHLRDNVYDVSSAAGDSATFEQVFLMEAAAQRNIHKLGGTIGGEDLKQATLSVEGLVYAATRVLITERYGKDLHFTFGGMMRKKLDSANKVLSYLALNAAGDIVSLTIDTPVKVHERHGAYVIVFTDASCTAGSPILIRMANSDVIYESTCR